jgi:hypothetical protein
MKKVKFSLFLIKHHGRKTCENGDVAPGILILGATSGEWLESGPRRLASCERVPGTLFIGGWVSPSVRLGVLENRKMPTPAGNRTSVVQLIG